jgi:formylglycine-generating enzyme required for sulfatase activity
MLPGVSGERMAGIFISHSSKNSAEATKLRDWLESQGWGRSQVFLDLQDLKSGDSWRDVLNAMGDKEAVIVCLSNEWLSSHECVREFTQAQERGKPVFPIFVAPVTAPIPRFITDLQIGDVSSGGFEKLRDSLLANRIAPQSFVWPPKDEPSRAVYRGLKALDVQDAAIFFGRDAAITRGLDELRRLRDGAPQRILVILGASGAGKSSFLRAGLIARLKRDEENFLVLPVVRPERAAMNGVQGLAASVSAALRRPVALNGTADLTQVFADLRKPVVDRLTRNAEAARETYAAKPPTIIIPLDQAEELFSTDNAERVAFCEMAANAIAQDGNALIVATIRSDSYEPLQTEQTLVSAPQILFNLPPIAAGSFQEIIEGPARLAKPPLNVEPELTQALLSDLNAADALPLLAFTLERLQSQYGDDGKLTLAEYRDKLGGLGGAIQSAVDAVLGAQPRKGQLELARRLFVPALVRVDQDGVRRNVARRADLPPETHALADAFVAQRLLVTDAGKIEVAHEAILRRWPSLVSWIAEDHMALATLDNVRAAAREWQQQTKRREGLRGESWLAHRGERLKEAERTATRRDFSAAIDQSMRDYLAACRTQERRAAGSRHRLQALAAASALAVVGVGVGYSYQKELLPIWARYTKYWGKTATVAALAAMKPGNRFQDCQEGSRDCPVMVVLPSGKFLMGSEGDLQNQREVTVESFAVSETEVTFDDWAACVAGGGCESQPFPEDMTWGRGKQPVITISWDDAQRYAAWLSEMTGAEYRLLSEAEWEYAARAGTTSAFSFGDVTSDPDGYAWYSKNAGSTRPVRGKKPNAFGLYDMHGNVWEWVQDCLSEYDPGKHNASLGEIKPIDGGMPRACSLRVIRGGAWISELQDLKSAVRYGNIPTDRYRYIGLRLARTLGERVGANSPLAMPGVAVIPAAAPAVASPSPALTPSSEAVSSATSVVEPMHVSTRTEPPALPGVAAIRPTSTAVATPSPALAPSPPPATLAAPDFDPAHSSRSSVPQTVKPDFEIGVSYFNQSLLVEAAREFQGVIDKTGGANGTPPPGELQFKADAYYYLSLIEARQMGGGMLSLAAVVNADRAVLVGAPNPPRSHACLAHIIRGGKSVTDDGMSTWCSGSDGTSEGLLLRGMFFLRAAQFAVPSARPVLRDSAQFAFNQGLNVNAARRQAAGPDAASEVTFDWPGAPKPPSIQVLLEFGKAVVVGCGSAQTALSPMSAVDANAAMAFFTFYGVFDCEARR